MRAALACAVGRNRGPIAERIEVPSLGARWRSNRVQQSVAIGVGQVTPRKTGELIQIAIKTFMNHGASLLMMPLVIIAMFLTFNGDTTGLSHPWSRSP